MNSSRKRSPLLGNTEAGVGVHLVIECVGADFIPTGNRRIGAHLGENPTITRHSALSRASDTRSKVTAASTASTIVVIPVSTCCVT